MPSVMSAMRTLLSMQKMPSRVMPGTAEADRVAGVAAITAHPIETPGPSGGEPAAVSSTTGSGSGSEGQSRILMTWAWVAFLPPATLLRLSL